ncbi:MAG: MopE-related protein [Chitinophagales bacterium]|nr:MopE-related protein [Chitinophagales bacterium]
MITASADSICGGEVITLNFTANPGTLGLTYNWEYSIDGGNTWNIFSTHPSPVYFTFNNQITQFRCVVTCTYSGDSTISNIVTVNPYTEVCNGIDDDCDYLTDDDDPSVVGIPVWYLDYDMDGYGTNSYSVVSCFAPPGYVDNNADCNDYNPNISPGAEENPCNSLDDNCNLVVDEGALPNTQLDLASCNVTVGSMSQVLRANHMASATQYEFAFFDGFNTFYELRPNRGFYFSLFSWPQYNTTYQVRVRWFNGSQWSCWGPPCQVTIGPIPTTQLQVGDCGATNVAPSQVLRADAMAGATQYEFEFYDGSQYYYELRPNRAFYFGLFWWDMFNTVYWVRVRWKTNNNIWSDWGPVCQVTTAPMPTTQLQPVDCGATVYSWTQVLRANNMAGASQYEFKVSNGTNTWYLLRPNRGFYFRLFGLPAGSFPAGSYTVEVRWKDGGTGMWSPWGPSCPITLATSLSQNISELEPSSLEVQVFPVPFDQSVFITIETSQTEPVQLEIIDLQGRLVERRVLQSDHNGLIVAGEDWAPGVYTLRAQQGIEVRTLRVVKAH